MYIAGFVRTSLIDYPGNISAVVFTYGCNFRCGFCHNPDLVIGEISNIKIYTQKEILAFLEKRRKVLEGVVITGGEPLINNNDEIERFIKEIKDLGYVVKIDTNGSNPDLLSYLIRSKLVDFVAMDIKNSPENYSKTINRAIDIGKIYRSIEIIKDSGVEYEFRSTILPRLHSKTDFYKMAEMIKGANKFVIQGFRPNITLDEDFKDIKPFDLRELKAIKKIFEPYVKSVGVRENF